MQDRYVGDVGDYGKYGLLRLLSSPKPLGLGLLTGLVWYRVANEEHNSDGRHIGYLKDPCYRACDPDLYDRLKAIVESPCRRIADVEIGGILPDRTIFFSDILTYSGIAPCDRLRHRRAWLDAALICTDTCQVVFLDPDNGIETPSCGPRTLKAPKYVLWSELTQWAARPKTSLLVYHHLNRRAKATSQISSMLARIRADLPNAQNVQALLFRKGSLRVFFIIPTDEHVSRIEWVIHNLTHGAWRHLFDDVGHLH
jgi:hypothetical protein